MGLFCDSIAGVRPRCGRSALDMAAGAGRIAAMGKRRFAVLAGGLAGLAGIAAAGAQELPGDPVLGRELARKACAECHAVEAGERDGILPDPPAFQNLADDPAMTPLALRVFLSTPHTDMPNLILSQAEIDDLIAWIHSLETR